MAQKPLKTLIYVITILSLCFTSLGAEEKYTANEWATMEGGHTLERKKKFDFLRDRHQFVEQIVKSRKFLCVSPMIVHNY